MDNKPIEEPKKPEVIGAPAIKITPAKPAELDWQKAKNYLADMRRYWNEFSGKRGYNPFVWIRKHIEPLEDRLSNNDTSRELYFAIMGLKREEPRIDPIPKK